MTHIAALSNDKGGVAKSQTTVQLAAALARQKKRVLVVDLDPQANATRRLGITWDPEDPFSTTSEIIKENSDGVGQGAVLQCGWTLEDEETPTAEAKYIDLLPSRYDLVNRDGEANQIGALRRLKRALDGWLEPYDFVLIDTQPSLGHLTQMAFAAADTVIIPTSASYDGAEGAIRVSDFVERHAVDLANPDLKIGGVVITMFNGQQNEDRFNERGLTEHFGDLVWKLTGSYTLPNGEKAPVTKYIGKKVRYAEADGAGVSLSAYKDKDSRLTVAVYDALAKAYVKRFGKTSTKEKAA